MENEILSGEQARECAERIRNIGKKWNDIVQQINSAVKILNEGVDANIQIAFNEVIQKNQPAFEALQNLLESLPNTIETAIDDISSVDNEIANKIRQKYNV